MTNNKGNTLAFLVGAAVGGATALLLAPRSGAETRQRLAQRARKMKAKAKDKAESATFAMKEARTAYREQLDKRHEPDIDFSRGRVKAGGHSTGIQSPDS